MIKKIYIDCSVIGGIFDEEFKKYSSLLFEEFKKGYYFPVISGITVDELKDAPEFVRKYFDKIKDTMEIILVGQEAINLSKQYMEEGKFSKRLMADTLHIACATVNKIDIIVSWNFKHIVNLEKIRIYNGVNIRNGYSLVEIRSPREVLHEKEI